MSLVVHRRFRRPKNSLFWTNQYLKVKAAELKSRRLRWAGHILRKQEYSIANLWNSTIEGKRPVGRPRSRWKDQVMEDIRRIKKDISLANNRKEWRKLVDEAKNLLGFQEPQRVSESDKCLQLQGQTVQEK